MTDTPALDPHHKAVEDDYNSRVNQWQSIYRGATYHDHTIQQRLIRTLRLLDALPKGGRALDVGCGAGQLVVELAQRGFQTSAVDLAQGMVEATRERVAGAGVEADVRVADMTDLPFGDAEFAVVTALGAIEYLPEPVDALREFRRVLKPGGHLIVTSPNPLRVAFLADPLGTVQRRLRPPPRGYPRRYLSVWRLRSSLKAAGLAPVATEGHGLAGFTLLGRPLQSEPRSIRTGLALERVLPRGAAVVLGANLIALARRPK